jgi:hypothetical protein
MILAILAICLVAPISARADVILASKVGDADLPSRLVSAEEAADGAPLYGNVYQFAVTTDADILAIEQVSVIGHVGGQPLTTLYNHPLFDPSTVDPSQLPAVIALLPSVGADSWIDTPGMTTRFGPDLPGGNGTSFGDISNNGPQNQFMFAQLTVPTSTGFTFSGRITIESTDNTGQTFSQPFVFTTFGYTSPEPSAIVLASLGFVGLSRRRRRKAAA